MSLSISIFKTDPQSGEPGPPVLIDGPEGLAGVERARTTLWGSDYVRELGARFLPRLAAEDLWVFNADLDDFKKECESLLVNAATIGASTGWGHEYVVRCLRNFIQATVVAKQASAGVLVD